MNNVQLLGRLTKDPELKQTSSGKSYCRFTIAIKKEFVKDGVDFINCIAWEKRAEIIFDYFSKGQRILVLGALQTINYEKDNQKHYAVNVLVNKIEFIESKGSESTSNNISHYNENDTEELEIINDDEPFPF